MKQKLLLLLMLTFIGSIFSLKAQTTAIDFNNAGFTTSAPSDPASLQPSNIYTSGNFIFTYTIPAKSGVWLRGLSDMGDNNSPSLYLGAISGGTTPLTGSNLETFTIQTIDGSGVQFQSFWFGNLLTTSGISKIEGYRNGRLTGSVSFPDPATVNGLISLSPYSYFNNVDKIIIYSGIYGWGDAFDDFVFAPALSVQALSQTNIACYGSATGLAMVGVSGGVAPYSYVWSPVGGSNAYALGLVAGTYTCVVTDNNGASASTSFTITQPAALLTATASKTDVSSYGGSDGSASVLVMGGTAPYTYNWPLTGGTGATATGLSANNYTVLVSDANFCQTSATVTINQPVAQPVIVPDTNHILYVTPTGAGSKSGNSWANATNDLQKSINADSVHQVWVAGGTYKPIYPADNMSVADSNNRNNAFVLKDSVKIFGGFAGTESSLSERDLTQTMNASILSGDLGTPDDNTDNSYHVVISAGDVGNAELNGFTIKGGNANLSGTTISVNAISSIFQNSGGGITNYSSSPILTHLTISGNTALAGGGIRINSSPSPVLTDVIISGNTAANGGGGIANNNNSTPVLTNVTISGNTTGSGNGGGIYNQSASPVLTNVTINRNTAGDGGGIYNQPSSFPMIRNSIIYGNSSGIHNDGIPPIISYSLVQGLSNTDNGNIADTDPKFVDAANGDYHLQSTSPLINKGNNAYFSAGYFPDLHLITSDIAGNARIQNGTVDLGAYESPFGLALTPDANHILYVTPTGAGSKSGNSWANATNDLQKSINADSVHQVWVAGGTYKPIYPADNMSVADSNNRNNAFVLKDSVKIYGGFAGTESSLSERDLTQTMNASILSGDLGTLHDSTDNAYHVVISAGHVSDAELNGFTVKDGNADGVGSITINTIPIDQNNGGGIYCRYYSSPTLKNLNISENNANSSGGGIYNDDQSSLILASVFISRNSASDGGGIWISGFCSLANVIIINNNATNYGGGVNIVWANAYFTNVTISGNTSALGGGIWMTSAGGSALTQIHNSIIYGNSSGIEDVENLSSITYSLIQGFANTNNGNIADTDPKFVDTANGDYRLQSISPLINKGNNDYYDAAQTPDLHLITTDIEGNARIQNGTVDLGAYESQATALPVILTSFGGKLQNGTANLQWHSGVEAGFSHYELQRSSGISPDGRNDAGGGNNGGVFVTIATIPANGGNSGYLYQVPQTAAAAYYRLKMVDKDGRASYSKVIVLLQSVNANVLVYPNPARYYINVRVENAGSISIYDASGRSVNTQTVQAGVNTINVSCFSAGVYYVVLSAQKVKFIKE